MGKNLQLAAVYLDLSRDKSFSEEYRAVFRRMAMKNGARELEIAPEPREKRRRRRRRRA